MFITCILIQDTFRHSVPEGLRKMHATACSDIRFSACYPYTIFAFFNPPCHCTLWQHSHTGIYFTPPAIQLFIFPSANLQFELQIMLQLLCSAPRNRNKMLAHTLTHTHVRTHAWTLWRSQLQNDRPHPCSYSRRASCLDNLWKIAFTTKAV